MVAHLEEAQSLLTHSKEQQTSHGRECRKRVCLIASVGKTQLVISNGLLDQTKPCYYICWHLTSSTGPAPSMVLSTPLA